MNRLAKAWAKRIREIRSRLERKPAEINWFSQYMLDVPWALNRITQLEEVAEAAHSLDMLLGAIGAFDNLREAGPDADILHAALAKLLEENGE